jgi:hypothetical protein
LRNALAIEIIFNRKILPLNVYTFPFGVFIDEESLPLLKEGAKISPDGSKRYKHSLDTKNRTSETL